MWDKTIKRKYTISGASALREKMKCIIIFLMQLARALSSVKGTIAMLIGHVKYRCVGYHAGRTNMGSMIL